MNRVYYIIFVLCVFLCSSCEFVISKYKLEYTEPELYISGIVNYGFVNDSVFSNPSGFVFGQTHFFADTNYEKKEQNVSKSVYITINNDKPKYLNVTKNENIFECLLPIEKLPDQLDTLRLFATHSNFDEVASAFTVVPNYPIIDVNKVKVNKDGIQVTFNLDFEKKEKMHQFFVRIVPAIYYEYIVSDTNTMDRIDYMFEYEDKRLTMEDNDEFGDFFDEDERSELPFLVQQITDKYGWPFEFKIKFDLRNDYKVKVNKISFFVHVFSYEAYMYNYSYNHYDFLEFFSEPIQSYDNVDNGKGCFGVAFSKTIDYYVYD